MPDVIFAEPATTTMDTNTKKVLSILQPLKEKTRTPTITPTTPAPITRPIDNHAKPHLLPKVQQQIQEKREAYKPAPIYDDLPRGTNQIRTGNIGLNFALNNSSETIYGDLAYEANWYISGLLNGFFPNTETEFLEESLSSGTAEAGFYELGKKHALGFRKKKPS
jgi:hypothetical protein